MLKKPISELCMSFFGANASAKHRGDHPCVQGRDFDSDGQYIATEPMYLNKEDINYTHFLNNGDVLFSAKGKIFATVWKGQLMQPVATGTFIVLQLRSHDILPEYLALYLNSTKAKRYFDLHLKTATVNHIGKKQLDQFEVEIPPIKLQELVVKVHELLLEEKNITDKLKKRKESILNALI